MGKNQQHKAAQKQRHGDGEDGQPDLGTGMALSSSHTTLIGPEVTSCCGKTRVLSLVCLRNRRPKLRRNATLQESLGWMPVSIQKSGMLRA